MTLPIDLLLIRHGQSEANLAKTRSQAGDHGGYTPEFLKRHTADYRLTELGRCQAQRAGQWLRENFYDQGLNFDRFYVSDYARAKETAGHLGLPRAEWFVDFNLIERDWGDLDALPVDERQERFGDALRRRDDQPLYWAPPNGESFIRLLLRLRAALTTLHNECSDKRVVMVCHGEVIWGFRLPIERMSQERFTELHLSQADEHKIRNCQILHYTRRNPDGGKLGPYVGWYRMIRPAATPVWNSGWQAIERPRYSNKDLLDMVARIPLLS